MASSARSKECETRMRPAMIRPDSSRKTASAVARRSSMHCIGLADLPDRPHFNVSRAAATGGRDLRRPLESFVEVLAIEDVISGELLFSLGEGAVSHEDLAVLHTHNCGGGGRLQGI